MKNVEAPGLTGESVAPQEATEGPSRRDFLRSMGVAALGAAALATIGCESDAAPESCEDTNKITVKANLQSPAKVTGLPGPDVMLPVGYSDNNKILFPCKEAASSKAITVHFFGPGKLEFLSPDGAPKYFDFSKPDSTPGYSNVIEAPAAGVYEIRI